LLRTLLLTSLQMQSTKSHRSGWWQRWWSQALKSLQCYLVSP
jgi:hypothetical protein